MVDMRGICFTRDGWRGVEGLLLAQSIDILGRGGIQAGAGIPIVAQAPTLTAAKTNLILQALQMCDAK
jgi:hypothetical protein